MVAACKTLPRWTVVCAVKVDHKIVGVAIRQPSSAYEATASMPSQTVQTNNRTNCDKRTESFLFWAGTHTPRWLPQTEVVAIVVTVVVVVVVAVTVAAADEHMAIWLMFASSEHKLNMNARCAASALNNMYIINNLFSFKSSINQISIEHYAVSLGWVRNSHSHINLEWKFLMICMQLYQIAATPTHFNCSCCRVCVCVGVAHKKQRKCNCPLLSDATRLTQSAQASRLTRAQFFPSFLGRHAHVESLTRLSYSDSCWALSAWQMSPSISSEWNQPAPLLPLPLPLLPLPMLLPLPHVGALKTKGNVSQATSPQTATATATVVFLYSRANPEPKHVQRQQQQQQPLWWVLRATKLQGDKSSGNMLQLPLPLL